jgi:hypothetical protein
VSKVETTSLQHLLTGNVHVCVPAGVQEAVTLSKLRDVFAAAAEAADEASSRLQEGLPKSEVIAARRKAAQEALSKGIKSLGIELGDGQSPSDLFSLARPLAVQGSSH